MAGDPTPDIPQIVEAIAVRPGDTLLLRIPERATGRELDALTARLSQYLDGVNVVILEGHEIEHVAVYRPEVATDA